MATLPYEFQVPQLPSLLDSVRYYISYNAEGSGSPSSRTYYPGSRRNSDMRLSYTLPSLKRDTEYTIQIRAEVEFSPCTTFVSGNYSDLVSFQTNATSELFGNYNNNFFYDKLKDQRYHLYCIL